MLLASFFILGASFTRVVSFTKAQVVQTDNLVSCVRNGNGNVRIVDEANDCHNNEHVIEWRQFPEPGTEFPFICSGCHLEALPTLAGRDLSNAYVVNSTMASDVRGTNFTGANLSGTGFGSGQVGNTNFTNANLQSASFDSLDVTTCLFNNANMQEVFFGNANASGVDFSTSPSLQSASFNNANLTGANFSGLTLASVAFYNANLTGANFTNADVSLSLWGSTICPDGTNSDTNGGTCEGHLSN